MGKLNSSLISSDYHSILLFLLLLSQYSIEAASCASRVKFLPGFEGPLPFLLETGYVGVGESEDVQTFYYFIESDNNPKEDPLLLWLSGGHGCSSLTAFLLEIGPVAIKQEEYNGGPPNLILRNQSWNKVSSIIYADLPFSTGFSYARTELAVQRSDTLFVDQAHEFLRKWLIDHPNFLSNEVYIAGSSYSGIPIPAIVQEIAQANEEGIQPKINIQLVSGLYSSNILEPLCVFDELESPLRRSLIKKFSEEHFLKTDLKVSDVTCPTYTSLLMTYWANDDTVRTALNVRKGSIGTWTRCNHDKDYKKDISSSLEYHANLSKKGYRSLIYNGDHDLLATFLATEEWIKSLNYSIVDDWRPWISNGQVAGYTRTYSNRMTFATVKGAGHKATADKSGECYDMFSKWISKKAL
ncbi:serine carboxypeptidase-like 11 [Vigna radiata var. radiata]|uniref:Serine carboxypeptidase-like 11 n=1 Tax=Vigna radiata var. radiata TaxID=3916 RepID=A0A1S3U118_VIGRR|nr:serine carboxypeptidase-like 11 [Vigna radiata var. radiata]